MEPVSLLVGLAIAIGTGALSKVAEMCHLSKVWKRKTYRHETTRRWAAQMYERGLISDDKFVLYGVSLLELAPNKRKLK